MAEEGFVDFSALMHCAVYMLLRRGVVVYVGQSKALGERLLTHMRGRKRGQINKRNYFGANQMVSGFIFDEIWIRPCMMNELDALEVAMIRKYQPKYNTLHKEPPPPIDVSALLYQLMPLTKPPRIEGGFRRRV